MTRRYTKSKRLIFEIDKSFCEYGKNRIFLIGEELNDLFLKDLKNGVLNLNDSLMDYALNEDRFKWFIQINPGSEPIKLYKKTYNEKQENIFVKKKFEDYIKQEHNKMATFFLENKISLKSENEEENKNNEQDSNINIQDKRYLGVLDSLFEERDNKEVLLYIEDLDWTARLYSNKDDSLIKKIKDLEKLRKNLVVISIKNLKLLEDLYLENYDAKEVLNIAKAGKEEIEISLYRITWRKFQKNLKNISLSDLALNFTNSNTSLREVIRIFKKKIAIFGDEISIKNFEFKTKIREKILWENVILENSIKRKIRRIIRMFRNGESKQKGLLLYGPPGNGKTSIAKAIANEEKMYFLAPKLSELKAKFVGHSASNIRELFEKARKNEPCLIFLDEVDTLFPKRDFSDSDSFNKDLTNEFLQQLDGVDTGEQKIFVISATNREYAVDDAIKSRLGFPILIDFPNENELIKIYNKELRDVLKADIFSLLDDENKKNIIRKSSQMSGRDIVNICSNLKDKIKTEKIELLKKDNLKFNIFMKKILKFCFEDVRREIITKLIIKGLTCLSLEELEKENIRLFGLDKIIKIFDNYSNSLKENNLQKELRKAYNIDKQNGILLYGPPGNGKTEIVKYICKRNNLIFINVDGKSFSSTSIKECIDNLEFIFNEVYKLSNQCEDNEGVALFFDEFDSLANVNINNSVRGTLLTKFSDNKISGVRSDESKIMVIAATNFYDFIDEAIKRAGRFDEHIMFPNPSIETAIKLISELLEENSIKISKRESEYFYFQIKKKEFLKEINNFQNIENKNETELREENFYVNVEEKEEIKVFLEKRNSCSSAILKIYVNKFKIFLFRNNILSLNVSLNVERKMIEEFFGSL